MANIAKTTSGKWAVRWYAPDGRHRQRTCPTKRAAQRLRREVEEALAAGYDWQPESPRRVPDLEADVLPKYVEQRGLRLRPRILRRYAEALDLFIRFLRDERRPRGGLPATMLSRPLLEDYYAWLLRPENGLHKNKRQPDTARKIVEVAQLAWRWADDSERWPRAIPAPRTIEMHRSGPSLVVAPTWAEMDRCVEALTGWQQRLGIFLRYTGLRAGESMLLTWSDADLEEGTLVIRASISKNKRGRRIALSPHLLAEMAGWGTREGYLIPSGRAKGPRFRQARAKDFNRAWARAEVRPAAWQRASTKAFRKGWKTGMLKLGAGPDAIDHLQGHKLGHGSRSAYIDPWQALRLQEVVRLIPRIGTARGKLVMVAGGGTDDEDGG